MTLNVNTQEDLKSSPKCFCQTSFYLFFISNCDHSDVKEKPLK